MRHGWIGLALAAAVLLAGCSGSGPIVKPTPGAVAGIVLDLWDEPIEGAEVWVEAVDLTRPVNNAAAYANVKAVTRTTTDADGRFTIALAGNEAPFVTARHPGHRPVRAVPLVDGDAATVILRMSPADGPLVIAHRGGAEYAPENTLSAFRKSLLLGVDILELDVQLTRDGQLVVMHDLRLDRTTSGFGPVAARTLGEIQSLDAGYWFMFGGFSGERPPSLRDVLQFIADEPVRLVIDVKAQPGLHAPTVDRVVELVQEHGLKDRVIIAGFAEETTARCRAYEGYTCVFMGRASQSEDEVIASAVSVDAHGVRVVAQRFHGALGERLASYGFDVIVGSANDVWSWELGQDLGVLAIGTDRPGHAIAFLAGRATPPELFS